MRIFAIWAIFPAAQGLSIGASLAIALRIRAIAATLRPCALAYSRVRLYPGGSKAPRMGRRSVAGKQGEGRPSPCTPPKGEHLMPRTKADKRREQIRDELWPESEQRIWQSAREMGYWCAPRVLPLLLHLTKDQRIVGKADCSFVYLQLLSRDFGQGLVEIRDEDEHAFGAGYLGERARRTWQERMRILSENGFIEVAPKGNKTYGFVLIVHPLVYVQEFREHGILSERWWNSFQHLLAESGLKLNGRSGPTASIAGAELRTA